MNKKLVAAILFLIPIANSFAQSPDIEKIMAENNIVCTGIGIIKDGKLTSTMVYSELYIKERMHLNSGASTRLGPGALAYSCLLPSVSKADAVLYEYEHTGVHQLS